MIIVFDNFNRTDNPTSLGTATTGQVWSQFLSNPAGPSYAGFGLVSGQAVRFATPPGQEGTNAWAFVEARTSTISVRATLPTPMPYQGRLGVLARWTDDTSYAALFWDLNFPALRLGVSNGGFSDEAGTIIPAGIPDNSVIRLDCCGNNYKGYVNDVLYLDYNSNLVPVQPPGTKAGLYAQDAIIGGANNLYDDFTVTDLPGCPSQSWNCVATVCTDPGDGSGTYTTLPECVANCGTPPVLPPHTQTQRFGGVGLGTGSKWWVVPQLTDSGDELTSKTAKAFYVTGKVTNCTGQVYGYDVSQEINPADLESGVRINGATRAIPVPDTANVAQSPRKQVNVVNAVLSTIRVAGDDRNQSKRDQIDQVTMEIAKQGVRR